MTECFKIQLLQFDDASDIFDLSKGNPIYRIGCGGPFYSPNPVHIEADPFLFAKEDTLYLFYEHKLLRNKGVINMISTTDMTHWSKPVTVLEEPFHLSFPWVFEENGHLYMIPESGDDHSIRLYEATDYTLRSFKLVKKILVSENTDEKIGFCDTSIFKKDDIYYLWTTRVLNDSINKMELYFSESLFGDYKQHPCSPIQHNQKLGRNAGAVMMYNGKLLRFSQDCSIRYGDNVHISEITNITKLEYSEKGLQYNIIPKKLSFYNSGGHQFNVCNYKGKWIVATDAKEYNSLLINRIINKIIHWKLV